MNFSRTRWETKGRTGTTASFALSYVSPYWTSFPQNPSHPTEIGIYRLISIYRSHLTLPVSVVDVNAIPLLQS